MIIALLLVSIAILSLWNWYWRKGCVRHRRQVVAIDVERRAAASRLHPYAGLRIECARCHEMLFNDITRETGVVQLRHVGPVPLSLIDYRGRQ